MEDKQKWEPQKKSELMQLEFVKQNLISWVFEGLKQRPLAEAKDM